MTGNLIHGDFEPRDEHGHEQTEGQAPSADTISQLTEAIEALKGGQETAASNDRCIRIQNFRSEKYRLTQEIPVYLEYSEGQYIAASHDIDQYGSGPSPALAISQLCARIEDYYELLREEEPSLSRRLTSHLRYLREVLEEF